MLKPDWRAVRGAVPSRERAWVDIFDSFKRILSILACVNRNKCRDLHQSLETESNCLANAGLIEIGREWRDPVGFCVSFLAGWDTWGTLLFLPAIPPGPNCAVTANKEPDASLTVT
jgi:hypothetical protein